MDAEDSAKNTEKGKINFKDYVYFQVLGVVKVVLVEAGSQRIQDSLKRRGSLK